jgi:hypothetical protein
MCDLMLPCPPGRLQERSPRSGLPTISAGLPGTAIQTINRLRTNGAPTLFRAGKAPYARQPGVSLCERWIAAVSRISTSKHADLNRSQTTRSGLLLLVYALSKAPEVGWGATRTATLLAVSAASLLAFLVVETRVDAPLMPLKIFRLRTVAVANAVGMLLGGSFFAFIFIGTLYMQQVLGYSALQAGAAWLAASLTSVALAGLSQVLEADRVG